MSILDDSVKPGSSFWQCKMNTTFFFSDFSVAFQSCCWRGKLSLWINESIQYYNRTADLWKVTVTYMLLTMCSIWIPSNTDKRGCISTIWSEVEVSAITVDICEAVLTTYLRLNVYINGKINWHSDSSCPFCRSAECCRFKMMLFFFFWKAVIAA